MPATTRHPDTAFLPTRWSLILAASSPEDDARARRALEQLAHSYWYPLYAFIRRRGNAPPDAEDLTQEFFATFLEKNVLATTALNNPLDPAKGRFRAFLLACLKNFLANDREKSRAQKRGGGGGRSADGTPLKILSIDAASAESRYAIEPATAETPERLFERRWALALLDQVLTQLEHDYARRYEAPLFSALKPTLTASNETTLAAIAASLHMSPGSIKTAAHRLRRRYRDLLREKIADTLPSSAAPQQITEEIAYLLNCL